MDAPIPVAARALATGDPLQALRHVALRDDPPALALRGIAMAQLGEYPRARALLRRAARGFGDGAPLARARCVVAEAEVALALRDLAAPPRALHAALATLTQHRDHANALQARLIAARRALLLGRLDEADAALAPLQGLALPPLPAAVAALATAELALRALHLRPQLRAAESALARAAAAARRAAVPALQVEVDTALALPDRPAARCRIDGAWRMLTLREVAARLQAHTLVVDACRHGLRAGERWLPLARRPVLFALLRGLAEAWPGAAGRDALIAGVFRLREADDTHRARLRVEIGRLRALLRGLAGVEATPDGFALRPADGRGVDLLAPPLEGQAGALLALLSDGAAWSTSALALALGASQRQVQRALAELAAAGRVRATGQGRAQRWLAPPLTAITTMLLLPAALPAG